MGAHRPWLYDILSIKKGDEPTEFFLTSVGELA